MTISYKWSTKQTEIESLWIIILLGIPARRTSLIGHSVPAGARGCIANLAYVQLSFLFTHSDCNCYTHIITSYLFEETQKAKNYFSSYTSSVLFLTITLGHRFVGNVKGIIVFIGCEKNASIEKWSIAFRCFQLVEKRHETILILIEIRWTWIGNFRFRFQ